MYPLFSVEDMEQLELSNWGIPEPPSTREEALIGGLDLLVLPGLAFDNLRKRGMDVIIPYSILEEAVKIYTR